MNQVPTVVYKGFFLLLVFALIVPFSPGKRPTALAVPALEECDIPVCSGEIDEPACNDIRILFIIDDSGSMGRFRGNDEIGARFSGVENTVDILGEVYLGALETLAERSGVDPEDLSPDDLQSLPNINVAAIHFANDIDLNTGWVPIAPKNRESWGTSEQTDVNNQLITDDIHAIRYTNARWTDFRKPFEKAVGLFKSVEVPDAEDCPKRVVIVLTDGAPDEGQGELHRKFDADALLEDHFDQVRTSASQLDSRIYVLAFNNSPDESYWLETQDHWTDRLAFEAMLIKDEINADGETVVQLSVLRERNQVIIENNIGLKGKTIAGSADIPPYLEFVRIAYFAPDASARLDVYGPDDAANPIVPDGENVILTGEGTIDQVLKIFHPTPGTYRFEPTIPGGSIRLLFDYPSLETDLPVAFENDLFQQYTNGEVRFQLLDADGVPLQFIEESPPRFAVSFYPPGEDSQHFQDMPLSEDYFTISPYTPLHADDGKVVVKSIIKDSNGEECLLYESRGTFNVDPVGIVAQPINPQVCTPSGMPVAFPLQLTNTRTGAATTIDLQIDWGKSASTYSDGSAADFNIDETGELGQYEFELNADVGGEISSSLVADVLHEGESLSLFDETYEFTNLLQDHVYAFDLTGMEQQADDLSLRFNRWFRRISPTPFGEVLIGRVWFDWFGPQEIQISGIYYGESIPGIERFSVALVPLAGGSPVATSNDWQPTSAGEYAVSFEGIPLGEFRVVITDNGEQEACVDLLFPEDEFGATLISHYWEFLFIILVILLLIILLILLLFWLICLRGVPLVVYFKGDDSLMDAPARDSAHVLANLTSVHALYVMEGYKTALRKIERGVGWLHVFTQVEGFVPAEYTCDEDGQQVIRVTAGKTVQVFAEAASESEALIDLTHTAMVSVRERYGEWFKVRVTVPGYVDASTVKPPERVKYKRCLPRPLYIRGAARSVLRDAPATETSNEVARLRVDSKLVVMEDESRALTKIEKSIGWLLIRTAVVGYVPSSCVKGDEDEAYILVQDWDCIDVYKSPDGNGDSLLGLVHSARVEVLSKGGDWVKVEIQAQGFLPGYFASDPSKSSGDSRVDRPLIEAGQVSIPDCDGLPPRMTLGEYIKALISELGASNPAALARMRQVVGDRRARIILDDEAVIVDFGPEGLRVEPRKCKADIDGVGRTDSSTVLDLIDGYLEVVDAILHGRLHVSGEPEDIVRIFMAIEILLDASPRTPALQALAERFRHERRSSRSSDSLRSRSAWYPFSSNQDELDLLAGFDLLPGDST